MALTKVGETVLYAIASTASNAISVGSAVDVSTYYSADIRIRMGRGTGTAFTAAPEIRVEASYKTSPTADTWITVASFGPALGASLGSQAVSGTSNSGDTTLVLAAGTNFGANDFIFIHNTTIANSEFKHVTSIATATLTLQEALVRAQTGATARDQSEEYHLNLDLTGVNNLRVVVNGSTGTGQAVIVEAGMSGTTGL